MIIITALWKAQEGKEAELMGVLENMVEQVREHEPDCLEYVLHQSLEDKSQFFFYEQYKDQRAVDFHKQTPHFKALLDQTQSLSARAPEVHLFTLIL